MIRTYHDGLKDFPPVMLFDLEEDPHETTDLAKDRPEIVNECLGLLEQWHGEMMASSLHAADPMWIVMREGGPFHTRGRVRQYVERLRETNRAHHADKLLAQYEERKSAYEL